MPQPTYARRCQDCGILIHRFKYCEKCAYEAHKYQMREHNFERKMMIPETIKKQIEIKYPEHFNDFTWDEPSCY